MKLIVTGRQTPVSDGLRNEITRKLRPILRLLNDNAISTQCVIGRQRQAYVCDLTIHARQDHMLHAVGRNERAGVAVAAAVDKIRPQVEKLTSRWKSRRRQGSAPEPPSWPAEAPDGRKAEPATSEPEPRVIRTRRSYRKPMSVDDAVLSLAGASQPFVVFRQAATDGLAILFRRPDGHYGLIDLES